MPASDRPPQRQPLDVYETLLRYLLDRHAKAVTQSGGVFVQFDGEDAPQELLQRFAGHQPPLRPGSEFRDGAGVQVELKQLQWRGDGRAELSGAFRGGARFGAAGGRYQLGTDEQGRWHIEKVLREWMT